MLIQLIKTKNIANLRCCLTKISIFIK